MISGKWLFFLFLFVAGQSVQAQRVTYSEPEKDDSRKMNFEIVGKIGANYIIYKNIRNKNKIAVMDSDLKLLASVDQDYLPDNDKVLNVDFFPYTDFFYMIYQYRKKNTIHCVAARINGSGEKVGDLMLLDTTQIGGGADSKIYTVLSSEDKSKIVVFKVNSKNKKLYMITTILLDDKFSLIKKSRLAMPMADKDDFLDQFHVDNDGDLVFTKFERENNETISNAAFVVKYAQADSFMVKELRTGKYFLDDIHIKPDNFNKRYFLASFYFKQKRSNTEGYYFYIWDKNTQQVIMEDTVGFTDEVRREAKGNATIKTAFNDYFIKNIVTRKDGGFVIGAEAYYTSSRGSNWNRYNYMNPSYMRSYDYYSYSPAYYNSFWGNRWGDANTRYQADNITIIAFDKDGKPQWNSVINKEQFDDQSDDPLSYLIMNTGSKVHFLFNTMERRGLQLLNDCTITPDGKITRNPTLKGLDKGYDFLPKYGKQVSSKVVIIPCVYRNYICFAKLEFLDNQ